MHPYEYAPHQAHAALLILLELSFPPTNKAVTLHKPQTNMALREEFSMRGADDLCNLKCAELNLQHKATAALGGPTAEPRSIWLI